MNQAGPAQGVAEEWRRLLDLALETGESPLFGGGSVVGWVDQPSSCAGVGSTGR